DDQFGYTDPPRALHHEPPVRGARQDAAAGDRVAVDSGDQRLGKRERRLEGVVQRRKKSADVRRAFGGDADEIDAGGKDRAPTGDEARRAARRAARVDARGDRLTQLEVEDVRLAVREGEDRDRAVARDVYHGGSFVDVHDGERLRPAERRDVVAGLRPEVGAIAAGRDVRALLWAAPSAPTLAA